MRKRIPWTFVAGGAGILTGVVLVQMLKGPGVPLEGGAVRQTWGERYGELPLLFESYAAQGDAPHYVARASGYTLHLAEGGVDILAGEGEARVGLRWEGGNTAAISAEEPQATRVNYLTGADRRAWRTGQPTFARVRYRNVYDGVDLLFYGQRRHLEYDFVVAPGGDPGVIALRFAGARSLSVDAAGDLWIETGAGKLRQHRPRVYQPTPTGDRTVLADYVVKDDGKVGFRLAAYDRALPLVIDPVLEYAALLGGSGMDRITGMAVDAAGNAYLAGTTASPDLGKAGAYAGGQSDGFIARLDASGTRLDYITYLGGGGVDDTAALALAGDGVYVAGTTRSADFPTQGGRGVGFGGESDVFVIKLNLAGTAFSYSTLIGGSDLDRVTSMARDAAGAVYVAGTTWSGDFPVVNAYQDRKGGNFDAFAFKLGALGNVLEYSTYLGAGNGDFAQAIAVDGAGRAYVGGYTFAPDFPQKQGLLFQPDPQSINGFISLFAADGRSLVYSTLIGGNGADTVLGLAVGGEGRIWITGETTSDNLPATENRVYRGAGDAFLLRMDEAAPGVPSLGYGAYWGGSGADRATALALGADGDVYLAGSSGSADANFGAAIQPRSRGKQDGFVLRLAAAGLAPVYGTFIGGDQDDAAAAVAVGPGGDAYVAGIAASADFPLIGAAPVPLRGPSDAFVARLSERGAAANLSLTPATESSEVAVGALGTYTFAVRNAGPDEAADVQLRAVLPPEFLFAASTVSQGACSQLAGTVTCALGALPRDGQATLEVRAFVQQPGLYTVNASVATDAQELELRDNAAHVATTGVPPAPTGEEGGGGGNDDDDDDNDGGGGGWSWIGVGAASWLLRRRRTPGAAA